MRWAAALAVCACACTQRPEVPILAHHSISGSADPFAVSPDRFANELDALARAGFRTVSFHDWLSGKPLPPRAVILTFDDGYEDAFSAALPALKARGMAGTFFVVTGWVGADAARRVARTEEGLAKRYLVWPEVEALRAAGMEIGSHGETHTALSALSNEKALEEALQSRLTLEAHLHAPVEIFAYPFGSSRRRLRSVVREAGYRAAASGSVHGGRDRYELFRSGVYAGSAAEEIVRDLTR